MEINIRLVQKRDALYFTGKKVSVSIPDLTIDQLHTLCTLLKKRGIAAVPYFHDNKGCLIVHFAERFEPISLSLKSDEDKRSSYKIELKPTQDRITFNLQNQTERKVIEEWYVRRLQLTIAKKTSYHIIQKSPNVYYEATPIFVEDDMDSDVVAYRRFYVFSEYFEGKGLGFGVDIGTAYLSRYSVEYYFRTGNAARFEELKARQSPEYKGTLLYKGPNGRSRCYWDKWGGGTTLVETRSFTIDGRTFANSYEYFKSVYPKFDVKPSDLVAYVSFKGMGTVPVPAKSLFLTIATDNLNDDINQQDKYTAQQKRNLIDQFWNQLGNDVFGINSLPLETGYYTPNSNDGGVFDMPSLKFAGGQILYGPKRKHPFDYKKYYVQKYHKLRETGCYYTPPTIEREVHFVLPFEVPERGRQRIMNDLIHEASSITGKEIQPIDHLYNQDEYLEVMYDLKNNYEKGTVVFVFDNNDPSTYFTISQELKGWKIIRMTKQELNRKLNRLYNHPKGKGSWESYVSLNAFKVATELGCVPYMFDVPLSYHSQLVIDVSENYSHFGLGLLIYKQGMQRPVFDYVVKENPDGRNDSINPHLLKRYLKELIIKNLSVFSSNNITQMLVLRDGKDGNTEFSALTNVVEDLHGKLPEGFDFSFIEYHKKSFKSLRMFEYMNGEYKNPLEGSWLRINKSTAILFPTGEGTLTQGTASPILVKSKYKEVNLKNVLSDIFLTSQLNFGSPRVAQKLTYLAKRVDDLLKEKRSQMVTKIK